MSSKKFGKKEVTQIAREYIFTNTTYQKLAEKYDCSSSLISYVLNYDLLEYSRVLYLLADIKASHNQKKNMRKYFKSK